MSKKGNSIIKSAIFLGGGTFFAKLLGAVYRVPLTNIIGGYGLGLYQMVFPVYCVLLDFSGAGVPSAMSKLIAGIDENEKQIRARIYLRTSIRLFSIIGLILSIFMAIFSKRISVLQGDENAFLSYLTLSPSILLVCIISSFRGYFQGFMNMKPTAFSQVIEQIVKLAFGLFFSFIFMPNVTKAVAFTTLSITISEAVTLLFLVFVYKKSEGTFCFKVKSSFFSGAKSLIKLTIPITLIGIILPLSQVFDSFLIVNILKTYLDNATSLYGLYSGVVITIINLPVAICYGVSATLIPAVSKEKDVYERDKKVKLGLLLTLVLSFVAYLLCYLFAPFIIRVLFKSLSIEQVLICVKLLRYSSSAIVFHALLQSINGALIGKGRSYSILVGMIVGVLIKVILNFILLRNPKINIYSASISLITCYFVAVLINLIILIKKARKEKSNASKKSINRQF